jgi:hypothetical protein
MTPQTPSWAEDRDVTTDPVEIAMILAGILAVVAIAFVLWRCRHHWRRDSCLIQARSPIARATKALSATAGSALEGRAALT